MDDINGTLDVAKEKISGLEETAIETIKNETHREKRIVFKGELKKYLKK